MRKKKTKFEVFLVNIRFHFQIDTPKTAAIFPKTSPFCVFIFFIAYSVCIITFGFLISVFFEKSKSAVTAAVGLWFTTLILPYFISDYTENSSWFIGFLCLNPNFALTVAFRMMTRWENIGLGLTYRTMFFAQGISVNDNLSFAAIIIILLCSALLFFLATVYAENVLPGNGVAKPWYFLCTKNFWHNINNYERFTNPNLNDAYELSSHSNRNEANFENEPINEEIGIEIRNLSKKFEVYKAVVNSLSLNIYKNQITSLLGHNGAGKTTTISMLTGMLEPTSGAAFINGLNIRTSMDLARHSMGFCPQHNILFDELTVGEHIEFYCRLKGLSKEATKSEILRYTQQMELSGSIDVIASTLSGGMKRKLSVVIALCGQSKIVFLDEPTSGMDPGARRALWNILLAEKKDRSILLTTHFMDEADVLSDRIAILADGELQCVGSSFFLKKRFGTGYHLICAKSNKNCDSNAITKLLHRYIPNIQVESENDAEVSYLLPENQNELFTSIFQDLENNETFLNLTGFGVSLTTLEEVFLKLGISENVDGSTKNGVRQALENGINETTITFSDNYALLRGSSLLLNQARAMVKKRFLCWLRAWPSFIYYNLFIIFMLSLITFDIGSIFIKSRAVRSMDIEFELYKSPISVLHKSPESK